MKMEQMRFIHELRSHTLAAISTVKEFKGLSIEELNYKLSKSEWSILECIEHLNLYGNFYLPEIERRILNANSIEHKRIFKSGMLGNYFVGMIKASNKKKIKATKQMDSTGSDVNLATIDRFIKQLERLDALLSWSEKVDLSAVKTSISLSRLIKLRLGDTLRFIVYHNERHIFQANRIRIKASSQ